MKTFKQFLENYTAPDGTIHPEPPRTYDINKFISLPWNWRAMHQNKLVNAMYYYYNNDQTEKADNEFALITLPNLKGIPPNELSLKNRTTGYIVPWPVLLNKLKNWNTWYDQKIDQIYDGIKMIGKTPEDFGGKDIR